MKYLVLIILILFSNLSFSQNIISGIVTNNAGAPIANANIVVAQKNTSTIIAFAISDSKGDFKINYTLITDSVIIKVAVIGYENKTRVIANVSQSINFTLAEHVTELPTVIIKSAPISENGDTTNYNVKAFTGRQDRVIGDVIAKLPGIEMDAATGQITFNGKAISHYYIDGLDLLEGKYNIANRNIPADLVDQVQLLKNHQDIRLFDSLNTATDPALNIKLKKKAKNKFIGRAKIGAGAVPMLWDNEITGLRFNKELQLITSFKNNNTGNNLAYELTENVTVSRVGDNPEKNTKEEIINKIAMPVPGIATNRYLFNNANLVHFNILKVLANKAQLKTNLSCINDYTTNESTVQSTYYFPSAPPVNFREKSNSFINSNKLEGDFFYTVNKQNIYLKNTTKLKLDFTEQKGVVQNNSAISQNLKNPFYQYSNELLAHVLVRKKIISFNSKINFNRLPQQLFVAPGQFADVFNQSIPYGQISQNAVLNNFNTDNSIAFAKKTGKFLNEIKLGTEYIFKNLQTDLNKISGGSSVALNDSFRNNVNWNNGRIYGEIATTLKKGQKQLSILLPVELNALQVKDKIKKSNTRSNYIFFNPAVDLDFPLSPHFAMGVGYNVQHSIGNLSQLTSGYVLTDYRDVSRNDSLLPSERLQNLNLSVYYKDPLNSFFANFSVSVSDTKKNIIFSQVYDNYFITSSAIYFPNSQKSVTLSGSLSKYFIEQKINLKLIGNGTFFNADLLQQNKPIKSISQIYTASLNADFSKWAVATFQTNSAFNVFNNAVKNENKKNTASVSYRLNEVFRLYFSLTKKAQLYFNNEYYSVWDNHNLKKQYFFGDIGFTQKFKKTGMEIEWTNYTNNKWYTAINNFQNLIQINTYKVRSSNVLVKFYFNF